jgi:dynein heavy chain
MRALRDMNMPKFVFDDVPLFKGLIGDLFPGMDPVRKPYEKKDKIKEVCDSLGLQAMADDNQIDKVVQLFETMGTRHTTMVVGPTGAGKSTVIEILKKVEGSTIYCINPKSITVPELYG